MSYPKSVRVIDAISTRYADPTVRRALSEVKAVIQALDTVARMPGGGVPEPIAAVLARADPASLPPLALQAASPENTAKRSQAQKGGRRPDSWTEARTNEVFDYIGMGHQIMEASNKFLIGYSAIRAQCSRNPNDPRLQHLTMFRYKSNV